MARCVLSDASPLIGLAAVDGLAWLTPLFGGVWVAPSVQREVLPGVGTRGEAAIAAAFARGDLRAWLDAIAPTATDFADLDAGETDCLRIALGVGAGNALVLMDERAGRAFAVELGVRVAGTAAVVGLAKKRGLIPSARACFERLHSTDFRISAAVSQAVLRDVGEL